MRKAIAIAIVFFWFVQFLLYIGIFFSNIAWSTLFIFFYIQLLVNTTNCHNIFKIVKVLIPYKSK